MTTAAAPSADVEVPVRGEALFRALERPMAAAEVALGRFVPREHNPLLQAGAIANASLLIAIASGVLLLVWYTPSVHQAHLSVQAMADAPWTAGLVRSVHRLSSDATVLFGAWHGLRLAVARRFTGPRWLAWVTGLALVGGLGLIGWFGYWLLWDEGARQLALGTALPLDALPIFAEPLSRSFLVDERVNSLLFFVVFFVHMLTPLPMAVLLWLHIGRVSRSRFLPTRAASALLLGMTVAASAAWTAPLAPPASMLVRPDALVVDAWYLWPLALTDRVGPAALWAVILVGGVALLSAPWSLARERSVVATVRGDICNACNACVVDCPYDAIRLLPRTDGGRGLVASVDDAKCVGCGICSGSCDGGAIGLAQFPQLGLRKRVDAWLERGAAEPVAFVCACSGAEVEGERCAALPGHRAFEIPCAGWLHTLSIERAVRRGAPGVAVVTCAEGQCRYREGDRWLRERVQGRREPSLRVDKVPPGAVSIVAVGADSRRAPTGPAGGLVAGALALGAALAVAGLGSQLPYDVPGGDAPTLVVSFVHPGEAAERCRPPTAEEIASRPPHMVASQVCQRSRPDVRVRVTVDDRPVIDASVPAGGLWGDGASVGLERVEVPPGEHRVTVDLSDGSSSWRDERVVAFVRRESRVVLFDRRDGFAWFPGEAP